MANVLSIDCPIDGEPVLVSVGLSLIGDVARDAHGDFVLDSSQHIHIVVSTRGGVCLNGHRWQCFGDLLLERRAG